jgi:hypothetical protein
MVDRNDDYGIAAGRLRPVAYNSIRDIQLPPTTFNAPFAGDSASGTGFQNSIDLVFDHNIVVNDVNSQAFLFHDRQNVTLIGNVADNVSNLISIDPYASPDIGSNFTVSGDSSRLTVVRRGWIVRTIRPRRETKEIVGNAPIGTVKTVPFRRRGTFLNNPG